MKKLTKANIEQFAEDIMNFLDSHDIASDVCIYYNNKRMISEGKWKGADIIYVWDEQPDIDPHDYFEYAAYDHILSMSFEGRLYDILNYSFGKREEQFRAIFEKYGLYFELGNAWNLTVYPINDEMEIEYTYYTKPDEIHDLYYHSKDNYSKALTLIMELWYMLSKIHGDKGSCVIGAGFQFKYEGKTYFMNACSPYQGSLSWEYNVPDIKKLLEAIGATEICFDYGRMD
jgi:hypothetical protein